MPQVAGPPSGHPGSRSHSPAGTQSPPPGLAAGSPAPSRQAWVVAGAWFLNSPSDGEPVLGTSQGSTVHICASSWEHAGSGNDAVMQRLSRIRRKQKVGVSEEAVRPQAGLWGAKAEPAPDWPLISGGGWDGRSQVTSGSNVLQPDWYRASLHRSVRAVTPGP